MSTPTRDTLDPGEIQRRYDRGMPYAVRLPFLVLGAFAVVPLFEWLGSGTTVTPGVIYLIVISALIRFRHCPLTHGPTYESAWRLADRAALPLRGLLLAESPFMGAGGLSRGHISLTNALVEGLAPDEIEAVIARELGHQAANDCDRISRRFVFQGAFVWGVWYGLLALTRREMSDFTFFCLANPIPVICLAVTVQMCLEGAALRAREYAADAFAVRLLGDPEPLVRALSAIAAHNGVPARLRPLDEALSVHPSLKRRIAAIRRVAAEREP